VRQNAALVASPPRGPPPPPSKPQNKGRENHTAAIEMEEHAIKKTFDIVKEETVAEPEPIPEQEEISNDPLSPPPQSQWGNDPYQMQQPPPQGWMPPPQMEQGGWGAPPMYYDGGDLMYIQGELEQSLARESDLIGQLNNVTAVIVMMEQREELHIRQLDVLTERIMDIEAQAAEDRNELVEYEANCTLLGLTIATAQDEADEWKKRCSEFSESREQEQEKINELKRLIKEKENEAEEIAIAIENVRLAEKRREAKSKGRTKKKSLLAMFFGLFFSQTEQFEEMSREVRY
jgi:hypothetical protein